MNWRMTTFLLNGWIAVSAGVVGTATRPHQPQPPQPQPRQLNTSLSPHAADGVVQVAQPFEFHVTVIAAAGQPVRFPDRTSRLGEFRVISARDRFDLPTDQPGTRQWTRQFTLESLLPGEREIPAIEITVGPQRLRSQPTSVHIASVLEGPADVNEFRDIRSVVDVTAPPKNSFGWSVWLLAGIAGLVLITALVWRTRRQQRTLNPYTWALGELQRIEHLNATRGEQAASICHQISSLLRTFLQLKFMPVEDLQRIAVGSSTRSANELVRAIEQHPSLDPTTQLRIRHLLQISEQAQFAGLSLTQPQLTESIQECRRVLEQLETEVAS